jgi:hypothetical protein
VCEISVLARDAKAKFLEPNIVIDAGATSLAWPRVGVCVFLVALANIAKGCAVKVALVSRASNFGIGVH